MILVLPPETPDEVVEELCGQVRTIGGECEVSRGDGEVLLSVSGAIDAAALEAVLARRPELERLRLPEEASWLERSRRRFVTGLIAAFSALLGLAVAAPVVSFLLPPRRRLQQPDRIRAAGVEQLVENSAKLVRFGGKPVLLIRTDGARYYALSALCTHMDVCQVRWDPARHLVVCPCHAGAFDVHGNVVEGPPPRPLASFGVKVQDEHIFIQREV